MAAINPTDFSLGSFSTFCMRARCRLCDCVQQSIVCKRIVRARCGSMNASEHPSAASQHARASCVAEPSTNHTQTPSLPGWRWRGVEEEGRESVIIMERLREDRRASTPDGPNNARAAASVSPRRCDNCKSNIGINVCTIQACNHHPSHPPPSGSKSSFDARKNNKTSNLRTRLCE